MAILFKWSLSYDKTYTVTKNMTMKKQDITNSKTWQKYIKKKNITQTTLGNYTFSYYVKINGTKLSSSNSEKFTAKALINVLELI